MLLYPNEHRSPPAAPADTSTTAARCDRLPLAIVNLLLALSGIGYGWSASPQAALIALAIMAVINATVILCR